MIFLCGPNYINLSQYTVNKGKNMKKKEKETSCGYLKTEKEKSIYINMQNRI